MARLILVLRAMLDLGFGDDRIENVRRVARELDVSARRTLEDAPCEFSAFDFLEERDPDLDSHAFGIFHSTRGLCREKTVAKLTHELIERLIARAEVGVGLTSVDAA